MAFNINSTQHRQLNTLLGELLDLYKESEFTKGEVIGALAHLFTAAALDNDGEVKAWIERPDVLQRWKDDILNGRL
ncbi:hypothetical protein CO662_36785 [Rhizobium anhuiense]|uniref:Uncharacterized protein n=1 Tax=Rhizobium anhuiense TaxID=1184720 RepID=A0ABX4IYG0_9HYPH|nr:hypothetical protein [Rhizobium anhuiense]PDS45761.1 hypothetical protein CO662_36785 [Rhizobium anhuiense]